MTECKRIAELYRSVYEGLVYVELNTGERQPAKTENIRLVKAAQA